MDSKFTQNTVTGQTYLLIDRASASAFDWRLHCEQYTYKPDKAFSLPAYKHAMLGTKLLTNRMVRLVKHAQGDLRLHFAFAKPRQSDKDYAPVIKRQHGSNPMADIGYIGAQTGVQTLLDDIEYDKHGTNVEKALIMSGLRDDIMQIPDATIREHVHYAAQLLVANSNPTSVCHVIADSLIDKFKSDKLQWALTLPDIVGRATRDGSLSESDKARFDAYDAHLQWLNRKAADIVKLTMAMIDKAESRLK